jgi:sigma-B regulation protein RsbU (phosphoserine phosphatase)
MKHLNEALLERRVDAQYATLSLISWDSRALRFTVTSAGTLPPLICRRGTISEIRAEGVPIGLLDDQEYEEVRFDAEHGDLILFYSDGVEDQLSDNDEYGRGRVEKLLGEYQDKTPQYIVNAIFEDIDRFRGATSLTDDQTVIALRVL